MGSSSVYRTACIVLLLGPAAQAQFAPALGPPFEAQISPVSVVAADFEGDHIPDLAVANQGSGTVTVHHNNGMGQFTLLATIQLPVGAVPSAVAAADFNGDGYPDLAIAYANSGNDAVTVWLNDKTGMFPSSNMKGPFAVGSQPVFIATGNFGSGNLDLAVASKSGTVSILPGNGAGGFAAAVQYPAGPMPAALAVADFNSDGRLDIAVTNEQLPVPPGTQTYYTVTVLLQQANGFVADPLGPFLAGTNPLGVVTADFNGDGIPDLAVANFGSNNVTVLLGNGSGGFTPAAASPPAGTMPVSIAIADFNGDRNVDLAVANNAGNVTVLLGNGMGGFTPAANSPYANQMSSPMWIAAGDFNLDGRPDFAVANYGNGTVSVMLNTISSAPTMVSAAGFTAPVAPSSLVTILGTGFGPGGALPPGSTAAQLGQVSVTMTDATGVKTSPLALLYASPTQINLQVPPATATGPAAFAVSIPSGPVQIGTVMVASAAPGVFAANGTGKGPPLGQFVQDPLTAPTPVNVFSCLPPHQNLPVIAAPNMCSPVPLQVAGGNSVLMLFGTGIRNRATLSQVTLNIGSLVLPASYAGPAYSDSPAIPSSIDQIDIPLPVSLIHSGVVSATVAVGTAISNAVTLAFQ